jgi:hypothetical protein
MKDMKTINQIKSAASRRWTSIAGIVCVAGMLLCAGEARAAAQPPYIGGFSLYSTQSINYTTTFNYIVGAHIWEIALGYPSISCDSIFFQIIRDNTLFESTTSGLSNPADWIRYDSGTQGSTRYIRVLTAYDQWDPYHNSYYLTYEDSPYSYCSEEGGYIYIYNP